MLLMWVFRIFRAKDEYEINLEVIQKAEFKKKKKKFYVSHLLPM